MKLQIVILTILLPIIGFTQTADTLIIQNIKTKREYTVQPWHEIVIETTDTIPALKNKKFFGSLVKQSADSIWIDAHTQKIKTTYLDTNRQSKNDSIKWILYDYNETEENYEYQKVIFAKENCKSLKLDKTPGIRLMYGTLSGNSLGTALIISPLISINYKTWNFNTKRFLWVSGISMVSATINFSLYKTAGVKRFNFSKGNYSMK